jgi:hypothetical protein
LRMSARKRFVPPDPAIPLRFHNNIPSWKGGELSLHPRADRQARKAGVMPSRPGRSSSFAQAGGFSTFTAPGPNPPIFFLCAGRLWSRLGRSLRNDIGPEKDAVSRCAALGHLFPIQSKPGDPIPRVDAKPLGRAFKNPRIGRKCGAVLKGFPSAFLIFFDNPPGRCRGQTVRGVHPARGSARLPAFRG